MQTVNLSTIELQLRVEGSNNLLSLFKKKIKKILSFLKTRFKVRLLMADIGQICRRPVFSRFRSATLSK